MNSKTAILVTALGLSLASAASAATPVIHITGSTAFRSTVHSSVLAILTNVTYGYVGTSLSGASQATFTGTYSGQTVTIETAWSGSGAGIQTVAGNLNVTFLKLDPATQQSTGGTAYATAPATESAVPELAMSDVYQSSTPFTTPQLTDNLVCVAPFQWVANDSAPPTLTNITPGLVQAAYLGGGIPLALFSGSHADEGVFVYPLGRDPDSGSRITAMAESGLGAFATVLQYSVTQNAPGGVSNDTIGTPVPFPKGSSTFKTGNNGFSSGGLLAGALASKSDNAANTYIGYLGIADAATAIAGGGRALSWNGVPFSAAAVQEGQYSFWGYEHLFYQPSLTGLPLTFANSLKAQIGVNPGAAGISISTMQVSRTGDGAPIGSNY